MVLYYLVHVKQPPVLPNLQRIAPVRPITEEEMMLEGRNVYFFDDVEMLRQEWSSVNYESVGELLIDFFRYFSHDFQFNTMVLSLRAGPLTKESKGWTNDIDVGGLNEMARDRNRLCIEDPFEITYNVARTVTKDGLYTIRGEFMRATRILTQRHERAVLALAELCREREDELLRGPRSASPAPRTIVVNRPFGSEGRGTSAPGWSRTQAPAYGYQAPSNGMHNEPARRGRSGETAQTHEVQAPAAQDLWLASQGTNLGNPGALGLGGLGEAAFADYNTRGRVVDPQYPSRSAAQRRTPSSYDNPNAGGTVSAPLSPSRLYAQLEIGRGPSAPWPASFENRNFAPSERAGPSTYGAPGRNVSGRDLSVPSAPSNLHHSHTAESPMPTFAPFSPPVVTSALEESTYISPSTLLSPPPKDGELPDKEEGVDALASSFGGLGVDKE